MDGDIDELVLPAGPNPGIIECLLESWELPQLIPIFQQNEVDLDALLCLSKEDIKELIPTIGTRAKLIKKLDEYKDLYSQSTQSHTENNNTKIIEPDNTQTLSKQDISCVVSPSSKGNQSSPAISIGTVTYSKEDVQSILESTVSGQHVLLMYKKNDCLDQKSRKSLVHILVDDVIEKFVNSQVPGKVFSNIATAIEELLPNEKSETYFIPGSGTFISKGKLIDRYRNKRRILLDSGAVQPKKKLKLTTSKQSDANIVHGTEDPEEIIENYKKALSRLNFDDPEKEELWKQSFGYRKQCWFATKKSCEEILTEWPALSNSLGYKLIDLDYKQLYPQSENIYIKWTDFESGVIQFLKSSNLKDQSLQVLNTYDDPSSSQETKALVTLLLLSHVCKPATLKLAGKKSWKPTLAECQEGFIYHVKIMGDIEKAIEERQQRASQYGLTVQPFIIVVAPTLSELTTCYVVLNVVRYKIDNILQAVDTCFKIFHVLNIEYPKECEQIWLFIEQVIYKLDQQKQVPRVSAVISQIFK